MKMWVNKFTAAYCQSSPQSVLESPVSRTHWPQQRWGAGWSSWPCHEGCRGRNCSCDLHLHPRWGSSAARCAWHWLCATAHHWPGVRRGPAAAHHHQGHTAPGYALQKSAMKRHQSPMKFGIPKSLWLTRWQNQMLQTSKSLLCDGLGVVWWSGCCVTDWVLCGLGVVWSGCCVMVWVLCDGLGIVWSGCCVVWVLCDGLGVVWWSGCCVMVWVLCDGLGIVWSGCCVDWVLCGMGVVWWTGCCVVWMLCGLGVVLTGVVWWTGWCVVWASCGLGVVCDCLGVVSYLQSDWALCVLGVVWLGCCSDWVLCRMVWVLSYLQSDGLGVVTHWVLRGLGVAWVLCVMVWVLSYLQSDGLGVVWQTGCCVDWGCGLCVVCDGLGDVSYFQSGLGIVW